MKKLSGKETRIVKNIKNRERLALGYEETLSFNYGYILSLFDNKIINIKFKKELLANFSNCKFDDQYEQIEGKYRRIL